MAAPITNLATPSIGVASALKGAADKTGVDFDYLYNVAVRESGLDPNAAAKTSSAAGLFQFIEQTWLGAVKQYGADHGLGAAADAIRQDANGGYRVDDPAQKKAILAERLDPAKASGLAAELALENKTALSKSLGREVSAPELYAAHFLGAKGAAKLLSAPATATAADLAPSAAKANRPVFYDGDRAKSVAEVVAGFERTIGAAAKDAGVRADVAAKISAKSGMAEMGMVKTGPDRATMAAKMVVPADYMAQAVFQSSLGASAQMADVMTDAKAGMIGGMMSEMMGGMMRAGALRDPDVAAYGPQRPMGDGSTMAPSVRAAATDARIDRGPSLPAGGDPRVKFNSLMARVTEAGGSPLALVVLQALDPTVFNDR